MDRHVLLHSEDLEVPSHRGSLPGEETHGFQIPLTCLGGTKARQRLLTQPGSCEDHPWEGQTTMCHPKLERAWLFRTGWSTPHPVAGVWHHLECSHLLQKPQELSDPHYTVSARSQRTGLTQLRADCSREVLQLLWGWCGLPPCLGGRAPACSQGLIRHRPLELVRLAVTCHPDPTGCVKTTPGCLVLGFSPASLSDKTLGFYSSSRGEM